jgi:hypothetical protein
MREIELDSLSDSDFQEVMDAANKEVLDIAKKAQLKINELLSRFKVRCELSLVYQILESTPIPTVVEPATVAEKATKKKRVRKKKAEPSAT